MRSSAARANSTEDTDREARAAESEVRVALAKSTACPWCYGLLGRRAWRARMNDASIDPPRRPTAMTGFTGRFRPKRNNAIRRATTTGRHPQKSAWRMGLGREAGMGSEGVNESRDGVV